MELDRSAYCMSLRGNLSPVSAKMTLGGCDIIFVAFSVADLDIEMNSFIALQWLAGKVCQKWRLSPPSADPLSLTVRPDSAWCNGIVVLIAFKTGLGFGPGIFQLWSVKPITYLLREETLSWADRSWVWEPICAICFGILVSCLYWNMVSFVLWIINT